MNEYKEHLGVKWKIEASGMIRVIWPSGLSSIIPQVSDQEMIDMINLLVAKS